MNNQNEGVFTPSVLRIIDANLNRLREGVRVVEDICRFAFNDKQNAASLKDIRHKIRFDNEKILLDARDIKNDILKQSTKSELTRQNLSQIIIANIKRAQESSRVLEEVLKTSSKEDSSIFKNIRYELYDIEKLIQKNYF